MPIIGLPPMLVGLAVRYACMERWSDGGKSLMADSFRFKFGPDLRRSDTEDLSARGEP